MVAAAAGWLPLTARQGGGHLPVVRWLVERCEVPVDPPRPCPFAQRWCTLPSQHRNEHVLGGAVHQVPVDAANKDGRTALQWASKAGRLPAVAYLIDQVGGTSRS